MIELRKVLSHLTKTANTVAGCDMQELYRNGLMGRNFRDTLLLYFSLAVDALVIFAVMSFAFGIEVGITSIPYVSLGLVISAYTFAYWDVLWPESRLPDDGG